MKKIGILTYHRSYNYGAFMQCYSLSKKIKNDYPECIVEVIDYTMQLTLDNYDKYLNSLTEKEINLVKERNKIFEESQDKYLPLSDEKIVTDDYNELFRKIKNKYDIIVVGSDAVWNWNGKGFPNAYFLGDDLSCKKFSYAASAHGLDFYNMKVEDKEKLNKFFDDFDYIGVREETTKKMVQFASPDKQVHFNCDPTVLLDLESLPVTLVELKNKMEVRGIDFEKPIIGLMAGNGYGKAIKHYFKDSVQLVALYEPNKYADFYLNDLNPLEWARVFSLFDITVTHFFHGTMLSLVNDTPVMAVEIENGYNQKYVTKIHNVLQNTGLMKYYRVIDRKSDVLNKVLYKLKLKNDDKRWLLICKDIELILKSKSDNEIQHALKKEAKKYDSFKEALNKVLKEENLND